MTGHRLAVMGLIEAGYILAGALAVAISRLLGNELRSSIVVGGALFVLLNVFALITHLRSRPPRV
jgi:hypothetical protein